MAGWLTKAVAALGYWRTGPAKLADPVVPEWLGSGGQSYAGKTVTVDSALQIAAAWACIRLNAQTLGTLPCELKRWDGRSMVPARDHPLWSILHNSPNGDMSAVEFWTALGVSLMTWGSAYAEIHRTSDRLGGRVVAITPLRPDHMTVRRDDNGALAYRLGDPSGARDLDENDVLHVKYMTVDGINGLSPIGYARHTLGLAMAADETAGKLFSNGLRIGGYLSAPSFLADNQRKLMKGYLEQFTGAQNAGRLPVLEGGFAFQPYSMPAKEAELLATREFEIENICRFYGVPPWMVGHTSKSTSWGTGLQESLTLFHTLTLRPILKAFEGAIQRRLFEPGERARLKAEFNVEGLLRGDSKGRAEFLRTMVQAGLMTINEGRAKESLPPVEGGDSVILQSNMLPLSALGQATSRVDLAPVAEPERQP